MIQKAVLIFFSLISFTVFISQTILAAEDPVPEVLDLAIQSEPNHKPVPPCPDAMTYMMPSGGPNSPGGIDHAAHHRKPGANLSASLFQGKEKTDAMNALNVSLEKTTALLAGLDDTVTQSSHQ